MNTEYMVSVLMTAYNHEDYVLQALEGVAKQITDFKVQVVIHDDASPDNTANLIRGFIEKHPEMTIEAIYQTENQFSKKEHFFDKYIFPRALGKYMIVCECDDFWTDEHKLQKQVDFLESHPEYIGVGHNCYTVNENSEQIPPVYKIYGPYKEYTCTLSSFAHGLFPGQTATLMYRRKEYLDVRNAHLDELYALRANGDRRKALELLLNGNIYYMSDFMSAYRVVLTKGTSWSATTHNRNRLYLQFAESIDCRKYAKKMYNRHFGNYITTLTSAVFAFRRKRSGKQEDIDVFNQIVTFCGGKFRLLMYLCCVTVAAIPEYIIGKRENRQLRIKDATMENI